MFLFLQWLLINISVFFSCFIPLIGMVTCGPLGWIAMFIVHIVYFFLILGSFSKPSQAKPSQEIKLPKNLEDKLKEKVDRTNNLKNKPYLNSWNVKSCKIGYFTKDTDMINGNFCIDVKNALKKGAKPNDTFYYNELYSSEEKCNKATSLHSKAQCVNALKNFPVWIKPCKNGFVANNAPNVKKGTVCFPNDWPK